jgi:hypothetical protein
MAKILMMSERRVIGTTPIFVMQRLGGYYVTSQRHEHGQFGERMRLGCPSWTLIEPCALRRSLILGESWRTFGRCSWPHRIKA